MCSTVCERLKIETKTQGDLKPSFSPQLWTEAHAIFLMWRKGLYEGKDITFFLFSLPVCKPKGVSVIFGLLLVSATA